MNGKKEGIMHQRTLTIFLASIVFIMGALLLWAFADGGDAPIAPTERSTKTVSRSVPVINNTTAPEAVTPSIDYAAILARFKGKDVEKVPSTEKLFALTFDGGGNAESAEKIVQTLSENGIRATFFLTGNFIEKFPDIVKLIAQSGNEIANHTATHKNFSEISDEEAAAEMNGMEQVAEALGVTVVPFFRFPYGAPTKEKIALVNERGYVAVRWTVDSLGWQGRKDGRDALFVQKRVVEKSIPGGIALMHLGSAKDGSTFDADALPDIIVALQQQGYRLVPLSELFSQSITK